MITSLGSLGHWVGSMYPWPSPAGHLPPSDVRGPCLLHRALNYIPQGSPQLPKASDPVSTEGIITAYSDPLGTECGWRPGAASSSSVVMRFSSSGSLFAVCGPWRDPYQKVASYFLKIQTL